MDVFQPNQCSPRRPLIMGILNVTPDSFSDGGRYDTVDRAMCHAEKMLSHGAHIIDVGGESTRPGAKPVSLSEEMARVIPVIEAIKQRFDCWVSVDTSSPEVMMESAEVGVDMINDVRALQRAGALEAAQRTQLPVCLMHMQGEPDTMQNDPEYSNVTDDVINFLKNRTDTCIAKGIHPHNIIIDPGFGFGKTLDHNYELLSNLNLLLSLGYPVMTGLSRKRMIKQIIDQADNELALDQASAAAARMCVERGASIVRVHNVAATKLILDSSH